MAKTFSATVSDWVLKSQRRIEYVVKESAQRVMLEANRGVPIDTGFAQASFRATLNTPAEGVTFKPTGAAPGKNQGGSQSYYAQENAVALVINGMNVGSDVVYGTWTASYVSFLEFGAQGRPAIGFLRRAAQNWQVIVDQVTKEARDRIGD